MDKKPSDAVLSALVNAIKVADLDNIKDIDKQERKLIDALPSESKIKHDLNTAEKAILFRNIKTLWKAISGEKLEFPSHNFASTVLNGPYWLLPGEIIISNFNHYQAIKENKLLVASVLNINALVLEKYLVSKDVQGVIGFVIYNGGIRVLIDRDKSMIVMQTNEDSWPWARDKVRKMWYKNKIVKIISDTDIYKGWETGVALSIVE